MSGRVTRFKFHLPEALLWARFTGYDADIVIWDSHPLALGATPKQVWIDGISQISSPAVVEKPDIFQETPKVPNFDEEAKKALEYDGLPPLETSESTEEYVVLKNVRSVFRRQGLNVAEMLNLNSNGGLGTVVIQAGKIICASAGGCLEAESALKYSNTIVIDLHGGAVSPGLLSFGSPLGLQDITSEPSTSDGVVFDPLIMPIPNIVNETAAIRAVDGLQFATRDAL
jgi:hypothetical protein